MKVSRREFFKKSGLAFGMSAVASQMGYFGMMNALAGKTAAAPPSSYKALVLVFLAGGNDGNNMVVPKHAGFYDLSGYGTYAAQRGDLAIAQNALLDITPPRIGSLYGLHPSFGPIPGGLNNGLHELFTSNKMAIVTNVGTLVKPTSKTEYNSSSHPKPFQLFSHADQIEQHQSAIANGTDFKGWGGRISAKMTVPGYVLPMATSIAGSQLFITGGPTPLVVGDATTPLNNIFYLDHNGNPTYPAIDPAFKGLVTPSPVPSPLPAKFVRAANDITKKAIDAHTYFENSTVTPSPSFPATGIGQQLLQVARLIKLNRDNNLTSRQIFFCQLGGFDTHAYQLATHAALLAQLSQAVRAFYDEINSMGAGSDVTTFTMSDFNRTLNPNSNGASGGSDHAWGSHHFVVGGAVSGGDFYGINTPNGTPFPILYAGSDSDADSASPRGRWIPTTAVEEYAAVLARWFGLPETEMSNVFPNFDNFKDTARCGNLNFLGTQPC